MILSGWQPTQAGSWIGSRLSPIENIVVFIWWGLCHFSDQECLCSPSSRHVNCQGSGWLYKADKNFRLCLLCQVGNIPILPTYHQSSTISQTEKSNQYLQNHCRLKLTVNVWWTKKDTLWVVLLIKRRKFLSSLKKQFLFYKYIHNDNSQQLDCNAKGGTPSFENKYLYNGRSLKYLYMAWVS